MMIRRLFSRSFAKAAGASASPTGSQEAKEASAKPTVPPKAIKMNFDPSEHGRFINDLYKQITEETGVPGRPEIIFNPTRPFVYPKEPFKKRELLFKGDWK